MAGTTDPEHKAIQELVIGAIPAWGTDCARDMLATLRSADEPFPCIFATAAANRGGLRFGFVEDLHDERTWSVLPEILAGYLARYRSIAQNTSLVVFFGSDAGTTGRPTDDVVGYERRFWSVLRYLHDGDSEPWPADIPTDTDDPRWEFSYRGTPIFVVCNTPAHKRLRSRRSPVFTITFQPRRVFEGLEPHTPRGIAARRTIRERLRQMDAVDSTPLLGSYGDPANREWKQYFLRDDATVAAGCPFRARADAARSDGAARPADTVLPAGAVLPDGAALPAGAVLPAGGVREPAAGPSETLSPRRQEQPMTPDPTTVAEPASAATHPGTAAQPAAAAGFDALARQVEAARRGPGAHALVRAFAANPAFRPAEWEELTTEDDPYRRPVRPADLAWLDYGPPLLAGDELRLSGLLGHRMLRNIYDADMLYLPPTRNAAAERDGADFYGDANRLRGALAQPVLEHHLFAFLDQDRRALPAGPPSAASAALPGETGLPGETVLPGDVVLPGAAARGAVGRWDDARLDPLRRELHGYWEERRDRPGDAFAVLRGTRGRREATTFALLQLSAYLPAARAAAGRASLGEYDPAQPAARALLLDDYQRWVAGAAGWAALLGAAQLTPAAGAYWQLYLNTSLARGNHLHLLSRSPRRHAELLGAFVHQRIDDAAAAPAWTDAVEDGLGERPVFFGSVARVTPTGVDELVDALLAPLLALYGDAALTAFHAGFADAARLAALWDRDLAAQLGWADAIDEHKAKAAAIDAYLRTERIEVDLDTFVESCDETSTTHVHDEHRLVMIESGDMHFWNNVTHKISLSDGDKILIPKSRLHGSTVLSGSCTYHQPIIPDEMYARF